MDVDGAYRGLDHNIHQGERLHQIIPYSRSGIHTVQNIRF